MAPFGFASSHSLSQRNNNRRSMQYEEEEEQRLLDADALNQQEEFPNREESHVSRRKSFWDVEEDFDYEEYEEDEEEERIRLKNVINNNKHFFLLLDKLHCEKIKKKKLIGKQYFIRMPHIYGDM